MLETITYQYPMPSLFEKTVQEGRLFLAPYSEVQKKESPCFFWGHLTDAYITSRCLITLSNVVQSNFNLSTFQMALLKDPIVTAGNETLRFEAFSHCAGVYARVDVLPGSHDGEFIDSGTTNIDFNQPMISALSQVHKSEQLLLSVGQKELMVQSGVGKIVERKVPLPLKWIKGLTTVQLFLAASERVFTFNRMQALQLFQSIPKGTPNTDYYLVVRGNRLQFSPAPSSNAICVGGIHRLQLLAPLLAHVEEVKVFAHPAMKSTTWQLYFGAVRFSFTLSRDSWRGFSGEGAALEDLLEDIPQQWIERLDQYSYANQAFNPTLFAVEEAINLQQVDSITARLSAMGLLGYDIDANQFFYRQLPYKIPRILSLNPRLKDAEKLLEEGKVTILQQGDRIEARVEGTGVGHTVILADGQQRCTCTWYARYQGDRGPCKHILAVKKKTGC